MRHGFTLAIGIAFGAIGSQFAGAQQQAIRRTEIMNTDVLGAGMAGQEAHMWIAEIPSAAATGTHIHPTPRFVYVLEGAVTLEVDGKPPRTFRAGEAFQEPPGSAHNFKNASKTATAKALGFQIVAKGQPLQY